MHSDKIGFTMNIFLKKSIFLSLVYMLCILCWFVFNKDRWGFVTMNQYRMLFAFIIFKCCVTGWFPKYMFRYCWIIDRVTLLLMLSEAFSLNRRPKRMYRLPKPSPDRASDLERPRLLFWGAATWRPAPCLHWEMATCMALSTGCCWGRTGLVGGAVQRVLVLRQCPICPDVELEMVVWNMEEDSILVCV